MDENFPIFHLFQVYISWATVSASCGHIGSCSFCEQIMELSMWSIDEKFFQRMEILTWMFSEKILTWFENFSIYVRSMSACDGCVFKVKLFAPAIVSRGC